MRLTAVGEKNFAISGRTLPECVTSSENNWRIFSGESAAIGLFSSSPLDQTKVTKSVASGYAAGTGVEHNRMRDQSIVTPGQGAAA